MTQRIHATLFHQGVRSLAGRLSDPQVRTRLQAGEEIGLSPAGTQAVQVALRRMDDLEAELARRCTSRASRSPAVRSAARPWPRSCTGSGHWSPRSCGRSWAMPAGSPPRPRPCGTPAWTSPCTPPAATAPRGTCRIRGRRSCWAMFEAGRPRLACRLPRPSLLTDVAARIGANRAALSVARKLARRSHQILRRLGDQAYAPLPAGR